MFKIKRFRELIKKGDKRTKAEEKEFSDLQALAEDAGYNKEDGKSLDAPEPPKKEDEEGEDGEKAITEEDIRSIVNDGIAKGLGGLGLDKDTIEKLTKSVEGKSLTPEQLSEEIQKHLGGEKLDIEDLVAKVTKAAEKSQGVTKEDLAKAFEEFAGKSRTESKMQYPSGYVELPIEHRTGNCSVAVRQLTNICLKGVSDTGLSNSNGGRGIKRPTDMNDGITEEQLRHAAKVGEFAINTARDNCRKALTTTGSGTGLELMPTDLASELQVRLYMESRLAAAMVASEINMPTAIYELPMRTTRTTFYKGSEGGTPTASTPGTALTVLTAAKLIGYTDYSYEADEDAIIAIAPMLLTQLGEGAAEALENAIINGDTTATHMDSDTEAVATHAARLFKGFRKYALAGSLTSSLATGGLTAANILALKKAMGKYGMQVKDLLIIAGINGYNDLLGLEETLTVDKVGPGLARILTGEAPTLWGIPILPSALVREDLNASGVYDGATTTKGSIVIVNRKQWLLGVRRGFTVETEVNKYTQMNSIIASFRRAMAPVETPAAAVQSVILGYNYAS